ncbi:MAG: (E)-4-hydroxy-3-methylbut-2-enyl-diphosphate synthase [Bacteroidales bacterium]|nr:(E)-4-hydroxy-3-methylbut-2-enyl-diphosphate synthase [Bacteroidales bacterium]
MPENHFQRFPTRVIRIGNIPMGGSNPIRVQSMTNTDTLDTKGTVAQALRLIEAGCEYVRISTPTVKDVENLKEIKKAIRAAGFTTPLIADVHFNPKIAEIAATIVEKVRINPGNYVRGTRDEGRRTKDEGRGTKDEGRGTKDEGRGTKDEGRGTRDEGRGTKDEGIRKSEVVVRSSDQQYLDELSFRLAPLLKICRDHGTAIRIGVNHGSLSERIMERFGDTPEGMVVSALEFARICEDQGFRNLVLSLKASNTRVMIQSNRLLVERMKQEGMDYPLHLGVTEAGTGEDGRLKSAVGIGSLLADGIGDTIRVSITEDPEHEIPVAYGILQATGVRITRTEYISCPTCARTLFNIQESVQNIKERTGHLTGLKIAVMGCIVNGPGEMADAHYGYVGAGKGKVNLYKGQELVEKNVDEASAVEALIDLIKEGGDWQVAG